jgi:hypothetical protein
MKGRVLAKGFLIVFFAFFLVGCVTHEQEEMRFPSLLEKIQLLDEQFATSYAQESLGGVMIDQKNIAAYLSELIILRQGLSEQLKDYSVMKTFLEARIAQLKAQDAWYDANALFLELSPLNNCSRAGDVQDAVILYASARDQAMFATRALKEVESTTYGVLLGREEEAPKWGTSDLSGVAQRIEEGKSFVRDECGFGLVS